MRFLERLNTPWAVSFVLAGAVFVNVALFYFVYEPAISGRDAASLPSGQDARPAAIVTPRPGTEPAASSGKETEAASSEFPEAQPPVTEAASSEFPEAQPPVTEPPVTEPPVTEAAPSVLLEAQPPVTEPPVTEPPVTEAASSVLLEAQPPVTEPPVIDAVTPGQGYNAAQYSWHYSWWWYTF